MALAGEFLPATVNDEAIGAAVEGYSPEGLSGLLALGESAQPVDDGNGEP